MPTAKSAAQRKAAERQRRRDAGLVVVQVWVHPQDREKLARYVKRLNQRAARDSIDPKRLRQMNKEQSRIDP